MNVNTNSKTSSEHSRYKKFWNQLHKQEPKLSTFIQSKLFCIELESLVQINIRLFDNVSDNSLLDKLNCLLDQFSNNMNETLLFPKKFIRCCIDNHNYTIDGDNRARNAVLITAQSHIWGILFIRWKIANDKNSNDKNSNDNLMLHSLNFDLLCDGDNFRTSICGIGRFWQPLNIKNSNLKKDLVHNIFYVQQVYSNYINSTTNSCHFDETHKHQIGFVWNHFGSFAGGDISHSQTFSGIGLNCTNFCLICVITQNEHKEFPDPGNRIWETRKYTNFDHGENANIRFAQSRIKPFEDYIRKSTLEGYTRNALYDIPPCLLSLAILHVKEGINARVLYAMLEYVNTLFTGKELSANVKKRMVEEHNEIRNLMLDMIEKEEKYFEILAIETLVESEQLEETIDYRDLKHKLDQAKIECDESKKKVKIAINGRKSKQGRKLSKLLMAYNIREFNPVKNSMQGRSALNFVNNWDKFEHFFDDDLNLKLLFSGMMSRLQFICNGMLTKNRIPYTDEFLDCMKKCIIEFEGLYKQYIKRITNDSNRFGYKIHYLYHCWEWCKFFRFSPAWIDDQRCEAFNLRLKRYWAIFASAMNHTNLLKMANTMIRHTISIDPKCMIDTIKQTNKLLKEFHVKYYDRNSFDEEHPIVSSDGRYRRFVAYNTLTNP